MSFSSVAVNSFIGTFTRPKLMAPVQIARGMAGAIPRVMDVDAAIDDLYRATPAEFIKRRDALAADLKAAGSADAAKEVRALRKPSAAAWAVNKLALDEPAAIENLLAATANLSRAHYEAGRDGTELRETARERQRLLAELTGRASALLRESAVASSDQSEAIAGTLDAASIEPDGIDLLRRGRLTRELERPDLLTAFETRPAGSGGEGVDSQRRELQDAVDERERELEAARRAFDDAAHEADKAREDTRSVEEQLDRARRRETQAEKRADEAGAQVERAEAALEKARERLADAG